MPKFNYPCVWRLQIIGDEVLKGSITDANTPWLAKLLYSRGVDLVRVEVVPDEKADIGDTARRLKQRVGPSGCVQPEPAAEGGGSMVSGACAFHARGRDEGEANNNRMETAAWLCCAGLCSAPEVSAQRMMT